MTLFSRAVAALAVLAVCFNDSPLLACCAVRDSGNPVVNADQTVIMIWDPATKTQHFIRQASFKSQGDDFAFIVPTPSQPELSESGSEAFPYLLKVTEPVVKQVQRPIGGCSVGCGAMKDSAVKSAAEPVRVLDEKRVAGFDATVLEADNAEGLVAWLNQRGYSFSPAVEAWARPYIGAGWKFTALKVAKKSGEVKDPSVSADALRLTFKTDRPLFPYREPDSARDAETLGAKRRLLRIYFIADARYDGELTKETPWTGSVAWANQLTAEQRKKTLELLKLPESTGAAQFWLTEFEDDWPYRIAPADVYFAKRPSQETIARPPIIHYVSGSLGQEALLLVMVALIFWPMLKRRR